MENLMDQFYYNILRSQELTTIHTAVHTTTQPTSHKIGLYIIFNKIHSHLFDDDDKSLNCSTFIIYILSKALTILLL